MQHCLGKHGHHMRRIQLHAVTDMSVHAVNDMSVPPCPKLQHLSLHACQLDLTGCSSAFCSRISTATTLTSLHINKCTVDVDGPTTEVLQAETAQLH
jgi:hypothetical protein